ncbi:MAG: aminotransferase class V-fold PLP-dependent enzyme [Pseudomonadota bacterium]
MTIYLDNAATSFPKPESVYLAADHFQREIGANPGRSDHRRARSANEKVFLTRKALAKLCNIPDPARIIFTVNGTEALNLGLKGALKPGDHVITSSLEHNSVNRPLHKLATQGVEVTRIPGDPRYGLDVNKLMGNMRDNTRMIVLTHSSNVLGTILPIAQVGALARDRGIIFLVDGAQSAGKLPIDVAAMGIDLLACSGHKGLFGPQGTGFIYIREGMELETIREGGTGSLSESSLQPDFLPDRFESGTLNGPGIAGLGAGAEFILHEGQEKIAQKEKALTIQLWEGLENLKKVKLYGPEPSLPRTSVVSFTIEGIHCEVAGTILDHVYNIEVRTGLHCAPSAHESIGTFPAGTIRVSPGYFNTQEDIEAFIRAVETIVQK